MEADSDYEKLHSLIMKKQSKYVSDEGKRVYIEQACTRWTDKQLLLAYCVLWNYLPGVKQILKVCDFQKVDRDIFARCVGEQKWEMAAAFIDECNNYAIISSWLHASDGSKIEQHVVPLLKLEAKVNFVRQKVKDIRANERGALLLLVVGILAIVSLFSAVIYRDMANR